MATLLLIPAGAVLAFRLWWQLRRRADTALIKKFAPQAKIDFDAN
ncbi:hypothetical protein [Micromonospora sp. NPDC047738]